MPRRQPTRATPQHEAANTTKAVAVTDPADLFGERIEDWLVACHDGRYVLTHTTKQRKRIYLTAEQLLAYYGRIRSEALRRGVALR